MMSQVPGAQFGGGTEVTLLTPTASDTEAVLAMLVRCSRASLFHRFHGLTDGVAYFEALLRDRPLDQTLLAWWGSACVGVADLAVSATGTLDLGVLVEDAWQRRGIGTRLAATLLDNARANGATTAHADVLGDNRFILQALRRIGPLTVSIDSGILSIDIDLCCQPGRPAGIGRPVGVRHCDRWRGSSRRVPVTDLAEYRGARP
jgi:GNAT superfamily N-acetyltransferase